MHATTSSDRAGEPAGRRSGSTVPLALGALLWLAAVGGALAMLNGYALEPGDAKRAPDRWPTASAIARDQSRPVLLMFVHPRCPCTRASLGELERLLAACQDQLSAHVLFLQPLDEPAGWIDTDLWRAAATVPGLAVHRDQGGAEARRFGAETSGHTVLYDRAGRLAFQGGITISRGHAGDNPGRSAIVAWVRGEGGPVPGATPVFGCALFQAENRR
ncbi:MAG: RedB protein [Planctomycetota bacterium]